MESEVKLVRAQMLKHGLPIRETPPDDLEGAEIVSRRRLMRVEVDDMMLEGFQTGDVAALAIRMGRCAMSNIGTMLQFGAIPEFAHFAEGVKDLLEHAQHKIDRALLAQDWHDVRVGCCQFETVLYGLVVNLNLPYPNIISYLHQCYMDGLEVDRKVVAAMLRQAGLDVPPDTPAAANDGDAA